MKYAPLHIHTEYSTSDSIIKISDMYNFLAQNNMHSFAITDHGTMSGCAEMFTVKEELLSQIQDTELKSKIEKIKPIVGCEFYACGDISKERDLHSNIYHLILLAKNKIGYKNLCILNSIAWIKGHFCRPRIDNKILEQYKDGLICLSACIQGEVAKKILAGNKKEATETAKFYKNLFGEDYYLELQDNGLEEQKQVNEFLLELSKELNIKTVITNDAHYLRKSDADAHDTMMCIAYDWEKEDPNRFKFPNDDFYIKTPEELKQAFSWMDEELFNNSINATVEIANKCNFKIDEQFGKFKDYLPKYPCPNDLSDIDYLNELCKKGLKEKYSNAIPETVMNRYKHEMELVSKNDIASYFLLIWDILKYAKRQEINFEQPNGMISNSIIAYILGIINKEPTSDINSFNNYNISIKIAKDRYCQVFDYIVEKYGENKTALVVSPNEEDDPMNIGVIIAKNPIMEILPLKQPACRDIAAQYSKEIIEKIGLFKIDFVRSETITNIS